MKKSTPNEGRRKKKKAHNKHYTYSNTHTIHIISIIYIGIYCTSIYRSWVTIEWLLAATAIVAASGAEKKREKLNWIDGKMYGYTCT